MKVTLLFLLSSAYTSLLNHDIRIKTPTKAQPSRQKAAKLHR